MLRDVKCPKGEKCQKRQVKNVPNTKHITIVSFFAAIHQICCMKYLKVSCYLFLQFRRNALRMYSKRPKKTSLEWRPWDVVRASILNLSYKCIFILFYQICASNTKDLAVLVLGFWRNVPKTFYKGPKVMLGG